MLLTLLSICGSHFQSFHYYFRDCAYFRSSVHSSKEMRTLISERLRSLRHAAILNILRNRFRGHTITQNHNCPGQKSSSGLAFIVPLAAIFCGLGSTALLLYPALSVTFCTRRFLEAVFSKCPLWSSATRLHLPLRAPVGFEPVVLGKFKLWEGAENAVRVCYGALSQRSNCVYVYVCTMGGRGRTYLINPTEKYVT